MYFCRSFNLNFSGDSIELLWGFMNTLQLISYFQFLSLYYTVLLAKFLQSLDVASLNIEIAFIDDIIDDIKDSLLNINDYNLGSNDEKIQENGIDSSSILRNASGILLILFQGS